MNSKILLVTMFVLTLALSSCGGYVPVTGNDEIVVTIEAEEATGVANQGNQSQSEAIGTVSNIRAQVHAGPRDNLKLTEGESQLRNDDFVSVSEGGKARLAFPGPIILLLYNQSDMDGIRLEYDANSNPQITSRLIRGGFSGYVEPEHQLTIGLAFGVQVNVLGTSFFVVYDETSGFITIGKFDGTLIVSIPGQNDVHLEDGDLTDISPDGTTRRINPLPFTAADFENMADTCSSPIQGLNILRRDNGLPLPEKETADRNAQLPCGSSSESASPAVTPACQTGLATVKANSAYLREGPDLRFASFSQQSNGDQLTVLGRYKDWFQVQSSGGRKGWLYKDWLTMEPGVDVDSLCTVSETEIPVIPLDVVTPKKEECEPTYYDSCN